MGEIKYHTFVVYGYLFKEKKTKAKMANYSRVRRFKYVLSYLYFYVMNTFHYLLKWGKGGREN